MILPCDNEERGETTENVFAGKDTMKTVMCDITTLNLKCIQSWMHEVLNYYSIGYLIRVHWPKVVEMQQRTMKKKGYWSLQTTSNQNMLGNVYENITTSSWHYSCARSVCCRWIVLLGPVHNVSGYFWIRNFFFAYSAFVHTYPVNPANESATFFYPFSLVGIFEYAMNPESCGR